MIALLAKAGGGLRLLPASAARSDLLTRRLRNPFGFLRIRTRTGKLRRQIAETLAVLAADHDRQDGVWKAAQQLAVSGKFSDANTVGNIGYTLAKTGYPPNIGVCLGSLVSMGYSERAPFPFDGTINRIHVAYT